MKQQLQHLINRYLEGKLNLKEQIDLSEQLADEDNRLAEEVLSKDWNSQLDSKIVSDKDFSTILDRVHHHIRLNEDNKPIRLNWWQGFQRVAAILIIPLLFSFLAYLFHMLKFNAQWESAPNVNFPMDRLFT